MNRREGMKICVSLSCLAILPLLIGQGCPDGSGLGLPGGGDPGYVNVTPTEAQALIEAHQGDPNFVILDVRNPEEAQISRIAGSILIPLGELPDRAGRVRRPGSSTGPGVLVPHTCLWER